MKISLIVPVHNEEERIYDCLDQLFRSLPDDYEIIVSADGCTDRTIEAAKHFEVKVATFHEKLGKGGGILNALRVADGEVIVIF